MGDSSPHVLERPRRSVGRHGDRVSTLVLDATSPQLPLGFLRGKAFCVYISNVYDNLPTDEIASISGRPYLVQARAFVPNGHAAEIAARYDIAPAELAWMVARLLRLGPELLSEAAPPLFAVPEHAVAFWRDLWGPLRLPERYGPIEGLGSFPPSPPPTAPIPHPLPPAHPATR